MTPALAWLDERLAAQGTTADAVVRDEHQRQGAATVTVRNIITSMRLISDVDWAELFERISLVDDALARRQRLSPRWISRRAISTAAQSRNWRAARSAPRSRSRAAQSWRRSRLHCRRERGGEAPGRSRLSSDRRRPPAFEAAIGFRPPPRAWLGARAGRWASAAMSARSLSSPRSCSPSRCSRLPRQGCMGRGSSLLGVSERSPRSTWRSRW